MAQTDPPLESMYDQPVEPDPAPPRDDPPDSQVLEPWPQPPRPSPQEPPGPPTERQADPFPQEFPEGCQEPFQGLLLLGQLDHWFTWVGHRFHIRTCLPSELAEGARWAARYRDTDGYVKAYQAAVLAACVVTVDGRPLPVVPLHDGQSVVGENAQWVLDHWFPPVLDKVHEEYILLEIKAREILDAMGKASG